jgi:hypothetical protein
LDGNCAVHGIGSAAELGKRAVAGELEDTSAKLGSYRREYFTSQPE